MKISNSISFGLEPSSSFAQFCSDNLRIYNNIENKYAPFNLTAVQKRVIANYDEHNRIIVKKYRQAGITTLTTAWIVKKITESTEHVAVYSPNSQTSNNIIKKVRNFLIQLGIDSRQYDNKNYIRLQNGSSIKVLNTVYDTYSFAPSILYLDEAAYIQNGDMIHSLFASVTENGKIILASTPNGYDNFFYRLYENADFTNVDVNWYEDSRYNRSLEWEYFNGEIYLPRSEWYERMCILFKHNKKKIEQEIFGKFVE